jgi:hypothetical protein
MDPLWHFKIGAGGEWLTGEEAGVERCTVELASRGKDTAVLYMDPARVVSYRDPVEIRFQGVTRFVGTARLVRFLRSGRSRQLVVTVDGAGTCLTRMACSQDWKAMASEEAEALSDVSSARVILGQAADGTACSAEASLAAIVQRAVAAGAPIQFGMAAMPVTLPADEMHDLTCQQAIFRVLRHAPGVCQWMDYGAATPTVHFGQGAGVDLPVRIEEDDVVARPDLACPGVRVEIEVSGTIDGEQYRRIIIQEAGNVNDPDAVHLQLSLAGSSSDRVVLNFDVETEDIPDPLDDEAWWQARHPLLKDLDVADITIIDAGRWFDGALITDAADFPRRSLSPLADVTGAGKHGRVEVFKATVDIIKRDGANNIISKQHAVPIEMECVTTDAVTKTYRVTQSASGVTGEAIPTNLAAELLALWSGVYQEGSASFAAADLWPSPGMIVLGNTPIQTVSVDSATNTCTVTFGPPQRDQQADYQAKLQGYKTRRMAYGWSKRTDGKPSGNLVDPTQKAPALVPGAGKGEAQREVIAAQDSGSRTQKVDINPAAVAFGESGDAAAKTLSPTELDVVVAGSNYQVDAKRFQVIATAAYGTAKPIIPSTASKSQYMALTLDSSLKPVWDWIKFNVPS